MIILRKIVDLNFSTLTLLMQPISNSGTTTSIRRYLAIITFPRYSIVNRMPETTNCKKDNDLPKKLRKTCIILLDSLADATDIKRYRYEHCSININEIQHCIKFSNMLIVGMITQLIY